jgi:Na+/H+ antiporter NhaC
MDHGVVSLLPAVLAIVLAVWTKNVILSLFSAVAAAGMIHFGLFFYLAEGDVLWAGESIFSGTAHAVGTTVVEAIADTDHAKTVLFTLLMGGMVGVIGRSGGTQSVVEALARRAKSPRAVQMLSWLSGMVVFFDDYANCMIVGSAMGPLCDRYKVPRAKLAYIVDSTAAPVASLALISTWIGFEVGVIDDGLKLAKETVAPGEAYGFFVQGWPYRFYPILALLFVGAVAWTGRDFGPMLGDTSGKSVSRTFDEDQAPLGAAPWWAAALPIVTLVGVTLAVMYITGSKSWSPDQPYFELLSNADGYGSIVAGSFAAIVLAVGLSLATRALDLKQSTEAAMGGMRLMFEALVVLILAWALSAAMKELHAPQYLVSILRNALPAALLPTVTFLIGAAISFAVGSSYTTMGIMMPMVIPLAFQLAPGDTMIPLAASGSVLAGACFGDHCSPISDTTVLSSIGSGSELLTHVRTQLPYALLIGGISVVFGTLPAGYGLNPWIALALGFVASVAALMYFGKPNLGPSPTEPAKPRAAEAPVDS